jgi:hypothetical protein
LIDPESAFRRRHERTVVLSRLELNPAAPGSLFQAGIRHDPWRRPRSACGFAAT